jgi:hypothetical protein
MTIYLISGNFIVYDTFHYILNEAFPIVIQNLLILNLPVPYVTKVTSATSVPPDL